MNSPQAFPLAMPMTIEQPAESVIAKDTSNREQETMATLDRNQLAVDHLDLVGHIVAQLPLGGAYNYNSFVFPEYRGKRVFQSMIHLV